MLVVVMSAVDWWKTQRHEALAVFSRRHVQWIGVERFGKNGGLDTLEITAYFVSTNRPRYSLAIFTRC